jgi:hypothetical protein
MEIKLAAGRIGPLRKKKNSSACRKSKHDSSVKRPLFFEILMLSNLDTLYPSVLQLCRPLYSDMLQMFSKNIFLLHPRGYSRHVTATQPDSGRHVTATQPDSETACL